MIILENLSLVISPHVFFSEECNQPVTISFSEENFIAIQDQKYENIVETRQVEDHKQRFDIVDECINFLGMDDE